MSISDQDRSEPGPTSPVPWQHYQSPFPHNTLRPYAWHSIEGGMRQLGDIAFLLGHYEFAASTYRLAAQDYLAGNNVRWYGGVEVSVGPG